PFSFFFQAEDGIRDRTVTGVQTCALPIFPDDPDPMGHGHVEASLPGGLRFTLDTEESIRSFNPAWTPPSGGHRMAVAFRCESSRSEERRVGKEGRAVWWSGRDGRDDGIVW